MNTRLKSLLVLLLTFAAGGVAGGALSLSVADCRMRLSPPTPGPEGAINHLTEVLGLSADQQQHVRGIFVRHHPEIQEEFARAQRFRAAFMTKHFQEMDPVLTPEQRIAAQKELDKVLKHPFPPPPPPLPSPD